MTQIFKNNTETWRAGLTSWPRWDFIGRAIKFPPAATSSPGTGRKNRNFAAARRQPPAQVLPPPAGQPGEAAKLRHVQRAGQVRRDRDDRGSRKVPRRKLVRRYQVRPPKCEPERGVLQRCGLLFGCLCGSNCFLWICELHARIIPWAQQVSTMLVLETKLIFKIILFTKATMFHP